MITIDTIVLILGYVTLFCAALTTLVFLVNPLIDFVTEKSKRLSLFYAYVLEHEDINEIINAKDAITREVKQQEYNSKS